MRVYDNISPYTWCTSRMLRHCYGLPFSTDRLTVYVEVGTCEDEWYMYYYALPLLIVLTVLIVLIVLLIVL